MKTKLYISFLIFISISCKKEPKNKPPGEVDTTTTVDTTKNDTTSHHPCFFTTYSTDSFEKVFNHMDNPLPIGPFYYYYDRYLYSDPVFNPQNPYEIAYLRMDTLRPSECDNELWKFNFCTGKTTKLADHVCYSTDWSVKGWLIFTGVDRQIWKVKDNGDSLIKLTDEAGFNNRPRWSPNGMFYVYEKLGAGHLHNESGKEIKIIDATPLNWIDNDHILSVTSNGLVSYNIISDEIIRLHPAKPTGNLPIDRKNMFLYNIKVDRDDYWVRYNLNEGTTDTLRPLYDSYSYGEGDYSPSTGKIIIELSRENWKDYDNGQIYLRSHLLIMNPDGTDERLVEFPE